MTGFSRSAERGFTLLELLAVVLIIGLVAGLAVPNLGAIGGQTLRDEARRLSSELELARQRSIATGVPHRLVFDLDGSFYWTEWEVPEQEDPDPVAEAEDSPLPRMEAPQRAARGFEPRPDRSGRAQGLQDDVRIAGIAAEAGWVERGVLTLRFELDGTAERTDIHLARPDGRAVVLEVLPLADAVRVVDAAG